MRDPDLRRRLEGLEAPPRRAGFEDELWEKVAARDRAVALRWRRAAVGLAAVAAAAVAAAALVASARGGGATLDRTLTCAAGDRSGGLPGIVLGVVPHLGGAGASLRLSTGSGAPILGISEGVAGLELGDASCRRSSTPVPLDAGDLELAGAVTGEDVRRVDARCFPAHPIEVRVRVRLDQDGRPREASLAVASAGARLVFAHWTPSLAIVYLSPDCPKL